MRQQYLRIREQTLQSCCADSTIYADYADLYQLKVTQVNTCTLERRCC